MRAAYDAIVIGGGHNGLVTACYLARAKVERARSRAPVRRRRRLRYRRNLARAIKVSTAAYVNSLFRPEIIADLQLRDYGFEADRTQSGVVFAVSRRTLPDARHRLAQAIVEEIAKFSTRDAENYPKYEAMLATRRIGGRTDAHARFRRI